MTLYALRRISTGNLLYADSVDNYFYKPNHLREPDEDFIWYNSHLWTSTNLEYAKKILENLTEFLHDSCSKPDDIIEATYDYSEEIMKCSFPKDIEIVELILKDLK